MTEKAAYEAVAVLMGFAFHKGNEQLSIEKDIHDDLSATNPFVQNNAEAVGTRWKAVLGSEAWRDFRKSRRRILRGNLSEARFNIAAKPLSSTSISKEDLNVNASIETDLPMNEEKNKAIQEDTTLNNKLNSGGVSLAQRLLEKKVKFSDEHVPPPLDFWQTSTDDAPILRRISSVPFENVVLPPPNLRQTSSEFDFLSDEVDALEVLCYQQEDEIDELEDELTRSKKKNRKLMDTLDKKRRAHSDLENKCSKTKVELAHSREAESDLQLEMSRLIMVRDLEMVNTINALNNLYLDAQALEKENEMVVEKLEQVKKTTEEKETELLHVLDQVIELKRERADESFSRHCFVTDDGSMFSSDLKFDFQESE